MARRRKGRVVNGIVLLNKDVGGSSNHVLQQVRRLFQAQKGGHTGALDPLASGMLPICLGEATKFSQFLLDSDKTYSVTAHLGIRTTTSDADGEVVAEKEVSVSEQQVTELCASFVGNSMQVPSMYSALKYQGKPLYSYARQGIEVPREARPITLYSINIDRISMPYVHMTVHCSKGTYIRSLVDDIGEKLGCGAYVSRLHRTKVAHYDSNKMFTVEQLEQLLAQSSLAELDAVLLPIDTAVLSLKKVVVDAAGSHKFCHGQQVEPSSESVGENETVRLYEQTDETQTFIGVGTVKADGLIYPKRVVVRE